MKIDKKRLDLTLARNCMNYLGLAKRAGISTATITKITTGKGGLTTVMLGKIARALDVDPKELIKDE